MYLCSAFLWQFICIKRVLGKNCWLWCQYTCYKPSRCIDISISKKLVLYQWVSRWCRKAVELPFTFNLLGLLGRSFPVAPQVTATTWYEQGFTKVTRYPTTIFCVTFTRNFLEIFGTICFQWDFPLFSGRMESVVFQKRFSLGPAPSPLGLAPIGYSRARAGPRRPCLAALNFHIFLAFARLATLLFAESSFERKE